MHWIYKKHRQGVNKPSCLVKSRNLSRYLLASGSAELMINVNPQKAENIQTAFFAQGFLYLKMAMIKEIKGQISIKKI